MESEGRGEKGHMWFRSDVVCSARFESCLRVGKISLVKVWFQSDVVCSACFRSCLRVGKISSYRVVTMDIFILWNPQISWYMMSCGALSSVLG